jgi:protein disulfide-isomerase
MKTSRLLLALALIGLFSASLRAEDSWTTDYAAAKADAAKSGKKLLLNFTGSDWCIYCKKLDAEVLSTPAFKSFSKDYILVYVDFPDAKVLPATEKAQNDVLKDQFKIEGFPTLIVTDASGTEIRRAVGYSPGSGPSAYLAQLAPH